MRLLTARVAAAGMRSGRTTLGRPFAPVIALGWSSPPAKTHKNAVVEDHHSPTLGAQFSGCLVPGHTQRMLLALAFTLASAVQTPDYAALFGQGQTFETFLQNLQDRQQAWRDGVAAAAVPEDVAARARGLSRSWRILVVAEPRCSDSIASLPYIGKLVAAAPDKLSMRIVDSKVGRAVMEAHRTPDGRAATPTLIFIRDDGEVRAWIERPATLVAWIADRKKDNPKFDVLPAKTKWYADDAGKSTLTDIIALLER